MAAWQFWVFVALIVVGMLMMLWINEGVDLIRRKIDDLIAEMKTINSKIDKS